MYPGELIEIAAAAHVATAASTVEAAGSVSSQPSADTSVKKDTLVSTPLEENLIVTIEQAPSGLPNTFQAVLTASRGEIGSWNFQFDSNSVRSDVRKFSVDGKVDPSSLAQVGALLFDKTFSPETQSVLRGHLQNTGKVRLLLDLTRASVLTDMPWEALFLNDNLSFPVLAKDWSVIRLIPSKRVQLPPRPDRPLKILALLSAAGGLTTNEAVRVLEDQRVHVDITAGLLSRDQVQEAFQKIKPDVLYYFGHATAREDANEGELLLADQGGGMGATPVSASDFASMWEGIRRMSLAVVLGADTIIGGQRGIEGSVAGQLVASGTTCVIGASRPITAEAALLFTKTFFPALFEIGNVESALSTARHALERAGLDWSAFALVSSITKLDNLDFRSQTL